MFFSLTLFAQEKDVEKKAEEEKLPEIKQVTEKDVYKKIKEIEALSYKEAIDALFKLNLLSEDVIEAENDKCTQEVMVKVKDKDGNEKMQKKRLTYKEKKFCYKKVLEFRMEYTKKVYALRRVLLKKQQQEQLEFLKKDEAEIMKGLEELHKKYSK